MSTYLIEQLRESAPYLQDQGWTSVAELITVAASELEQLMLQKRELEKRLNHRENIGAAKRTHLVSRLFN
jgi:hypothetical protein